MSAQMLAQIPLLVAAGWLLSHAIPARVLARVDRWNHCGIAGLVLVTVVSIFWMLPRSLDAATSHPLMAAAKYLSVPLLIGLPFGVSWPRMGFVVRGVFLSGTGGDLLPAGLVVPHFADPTVQQLCTE